MNNNNTKKAYHSPQLEILGTVDELTQIGFTHAGTDGVYHDKLGYEGSVDNPNNTGGTVGGGG
jgi:hypothetical protein